MRRISEANPHIGKLGQRGTARPKGAALLRLTARGDVRLRGLRDIVNIVNFTLGAGP
jgi:hypothetical protein